MAQLLLLSDASTDAYGTATYILLTNTQGKKHVSFLMGKSGVTALKQITVPKMELMLTRELQVQLEQSSFRTDSTTILIHSENETAHFKTFVANRITIIRKATTPTQWRYRRVTN